MTTALINVGGVDLPAPGSYQVTISDIVKNDRNAAGNAILELIATKRTIDVGWDYLNGTDCSTILTAIDPLTFTVTYYDPKTNGNNTGTFYKSDRPFPMLSYFGGQPVWTGVKFQLIEK